MWVFGHLGIGSKMVEPISKRLPLGWLLLGTLVPDLIDKPLYYSAYFITGRHGADIGLISCTRTFGHTAIFVLLIAGLAVVKKSKVLAALALGISTHLVLDGFGDYWIGRMTEEAGESSAKVALLFPFYLPRFSAQPFSTLLDHLKSVGRPFLLVSEGIGLLLLGRLFWKDERRLRLSGRIGSALKKSKAGQ